MFETHKYGNETSSRETGLNIRTHESSIVDVLERSLHKKLIWEFVSPLV